MTSLKWIIPILIVAILVGAGVWAIYKAQTSTINIETSTEETPKSGFGQATPSATPKVQGATPPPNQPSTGSDELEIKNAGIQITNPTNGQLIASPIKITGTANVTSQIVIIRIKDPNGTTLGQGQATACVGLDACPFEALITFSAPSGKSGQVEVYSPSTIDNSPTYLQTIPVTF